MTKNEALALIRKMGMPCVAIPQTNEIRINYPVSSKLRKGDESAYYADANDPEDAVATAAAMLKSHQESLTKDF